MKITKNLQAAFTAVAILWLVYLINPFLKTDLRLYGLKPRQIDGLWGILFMPLLHMDLNHLMANSGVLFILLSLSLSYSRALTFQALFIITILGGGMVWLLGANGSIHIGASGIIFGLIGFLICLGVFRRDWKAILISIIISMVYGSALYSLLIYIPGVSWTGHMFGFIAGILAAWMTRSRLNHRDTVRRQ